VGIPTCFQIGALSVNAVDLTHDDDDDETSSVCIVGRGKKPESCGGADLGRVARGRGSATVFHPRRAVEAESCVVLVVRVQRGEGGEGMSWRTVERGIPHLRGVFLEK